MSAINQLAGIEVADVMTTQVVSVMADDSLQDVVSLMLEHELSTVPVVNSANQCIGIFSGKDMTELFLEEDQELSRLLDTDRLSMEWLSRSTETTDLRKVHELMNVNVTTIHRNKKLQAACKLMAKKKIHHLAVVDDNDVLVGVLSTFDVVNAIANLAS